MQTLPSGEVVITPRNFKLLEELEHSEKGLGEMIISYGLVDSSDIFMGEWNATIMGPHRVSHTHREREKVIYYVFGWGDYYLDFIIIRRLSTFSVFRLGNISLAAEHIITNQYINPPKYQSK